MPNIFDPTEIAQVAARLFGKDSNLLGTVSRQAETGWTRGAGSTVDFTVPGSVATYARASSSTDAVTMSAVTEKSIPLKVDTVLYNVVPLSVRDYADLTDFTRQVTGPQITSVAKTAEAKVAAVLQSADQNATLTSGYNDADPARTFTAARKALRAAGVPAGARMVAAVGSGVYGDLLDASLLPDVAADGSDVVAKVRGFEVTESTRLAADEAVFYVPEAVGAALIAPTVPEGADGASVRVPDQDWTVTWIKDYDAGTLTDRSVVHLLFACDLLPLAVDREDGTIDLVDGAGILRIGGAA